MNIFDILSHDERVIVLSNEGDERIITWNRSLTLQCWENVDFHRDTGRWNEINVRTLANEPKSFDEARKAAMQWQGDMWSDLNPESVRDR
jgi:hypothetical protein